MTLSRLLPRHLASSSLRSLATSPPTLSFNFNTNREAGNDFHYEEVIKGFRWEIPEYWNFSRDVIDSLAATEGSRTALWYVSPNHTDEDLKLSFQDLSVASQKAANAIQGLGVKKAICILPKVRIVDEV